MTLNATYGILLMGFVGKAQVCLRNQAISARTLINQRQQKYQHYGHR
jgi:hypothetical protein